VTARAFLALFGLLLLLPSANYQVFDGVPWSRLSEFAGLALLVPFVVSGPLRRLYGRLLHRLPSPVRRGVLGLAVCALAAKLVLLASGTHAGFLACYRSPVAGPPAGACERSYENPFFRFGASRIDTRLDFEPATWDLSFFNSLRFNFYPWVKGNPVRDRLPLAVSWSGTVGRARAWTAEIRYVGVAAVRIDSLDAVRLPPRYDALAVATVPVPAGRHRLTIDYAFDDGSRIGDTTIPGPYATFRLGRLRGTPPTAVPVAPARPAGGWRVTAAAVDLVVALLAVSLAVACARAVAPDAWLLAAVAIAAAVGAAGDGLLPPAVRSAWLFLPLAVLFGALVADARPRRLLTGYVGSFIAAFALTCTRFDRLDIVAYRGAGEDWLTYESFARSILETRSLRGDEDVFHYQPLFRYVRFTEHFLLGDGDPLVFTGGMVALSWGLLWMLATFLGRRRRARWRAAALSAGGLLVLLWASSPTVIAALHAGISEYPTWIAFPLLVPLLFASASPVRWMGGAILLGASFLDRMSHLPAILGLLAAFLWRGTAIHPRAAVLAGVLFAAIALLPGWHNWHYGRKVEWLTTSARIPDNLVLPPLRLLDVRRDADVQRLVRDQVRRLLYLTERPDPVLDLAVRGLQALWVLTVGAVLLRGRPGRPVLLLLGVPLVYLGTHVFYGDLYFYPRHFLIGYLAMGSLAAFAWADHRRAAAGSPGVPARFEPAGSGPLE
jgi:hypothetical protein